MECSNHIGDLIPRSFFCTAKFSFAQHCPTSTIVVLCVKHATWPLTKKNSSPTRLVNSGLETSIRPIHETRSDGKNSKKVANTQFEKYWNSFYLQKAKQTQPKRTGPTLELQNDAKCVVYFNFRFGLRARIWPAPFQQHETVEMKTQIEPNFFGEL